MAFDATSSNQVGDSFSNRCSTAVQVSKVLRCLNCDILTVDFDDRQRTQNSFCLAEIVLAVEDLQHLGQNQVACCYLLVRSKECTSFGNGAFGAFRVLAFAQSLAVFFQ